MYVGLVWRAGLRSMLWEPMGKAKPVVEKPDWSADAWARELVNSSSGFAVLASGNGTVLAANDGALEVLNGEALPPSLRAAVIDARLSDRVQSFRTRLTAKGNEANSRRFDFTLIPVSSGMALVLARDSTLEANLVNALAASRQLFRDLALCSNDFAFETDSSAHFTYVSPGGFLGHSSEELHGARPRSLFGNAGLSPLFSLKAGVRGQEVWAQGKSGEEACVVVTAIPMHDSHGAWCGTRGVVHNLTALRMHERQVVQARAREELVQAVVNAMRAQVEPRRMMLAAADALRGATDSDFVSISCAGAGLSVTIGSDGGSVNRLSCQTSYHGADNGAVVLARNDPAHAYDAAEHALLEAIAPHLGIAMTLVRLLNPDPARSLSEAKPC